MMAAACSMGPIVGSQLLVTRSRHLPCSHQTRYGRCVLVLSKPPYLRWIAAVVLIGAALVWDMSRRATELVPVAAHAISRGEVIEEESVLWKSAPVGLFESVEIPMGTALVTIGAGEPITGSMVSRGGHVPDGWWTVAMDVPPAVVPGSEVRVVLADGFGVTGVVVEPSREDTFGVRSPGLVAVPNDMADTVAIASAAGQLVVLFEP